MRVGEKAGSRQPDCQSTSLGDGAKREVLPESDLVDTKRHGVQQQGCQMSKG